MHAAQPEGVDGISSTAVRKLFAERKPEMLSAYLHEDVLKMVRTLTPEDFPPEIERFRDEHEFLSCDYPCTVFYDGMTFSCAEAAFQAARCVDPGVKRRIAQADGPRAKQIAAKSAVHPDWDERKLAVMEDVLRAKFSGNPELARKLAATGSAVLIYGNNKKDVFWGRDFYTDRGDNHLGRLLMKLRNEMECESI